MPCAPGLLPPGMVSSWLLTSQTPFHHFRPSFSAISSRRRVQAHEKPSNICGMPEMLYSPFQCPGNPARSYCRVCTPASPPLPTFSWLLFSASCLKGMYHPVLHSCGQVSKEWPSDLGPLNFVAPSIIFNVRLPKILCLSVSNR